MSLAERCFYLAAARDHNAIEYINNLPEKDKSRLGGRFGFVRVAEE